MTQTVYKIPVILLTAFAVLILCTLMKIFINASEELQKAEQFLAENKVEEAVTHYERAIEWFIPWMDGPEKAAQGLWKIAGQYETGNDLEAAVTVYRRLRGAFFSTRSFFTPGKPWIGRCNEKIAGIMAVQPPTSRTERSKTREQRKAEALTLLSAEKSPLPQWALAGEVGFFGWIVCALLFIFKGMTPGGKLKVRPAAACGAGFFVFYGLWILGMYNV